MGEWHREHPEEATRIAALPPSERLAAERAAIGYDPDLIRERAEEDRAIAATFPLTLTEEEAWAVLIAIQRYQSSTTDMGRILSVAETKLEDWLNRQ